MTEKEIDSFEKLQSQMESLHNEISILSKKSQNDALNKFKLKFINKALSDANQLLGSIYKPFSDFDLFDESELPTNSDVAMMLAQYLSCLEKLRSDNIIRDSAYWYWKIGGKKSDIRTTMPDILKEK